MKIRDIIKRIEADGWRTVRQAGSHRQYRHPTKPGKVTIVNGVVIVMMQYLVIYEKGPTSWGAYVPDLPGCVAAGETQEEVRELIGNAIELHLRGMREDGDPIPEPTAIAAGFVNAERRSGGAA